MKKTKVHKIILTIAMTSFGLVAQDLRPSSFDEIKERQVKGLALNQVTTVGAVVSALNAAHVPGGVATVIFCGAEDRRDVTLLGPTLHDALDSIVVAYPQYRWYVDQGSINVVPSNGEMGLLDIVIVDFNVERTDSLDDTLGKLLTAPEVKQGAKRLHLSQGFREIGIRSLERPGSTESSESRGFALHLQNATVREALNAMARAHGSAVWSYEEKRCKESKEFSIGFLVW